MTAKEFLKQAYRLNELINSDLEELQGLRDLSRSISSPVLEEKVSGTKNTDPPFVKYVVRIVDLEKQIQQEVDRLVKLKTDIREAVNRMENVDEKLLLRYRYINFLNWEEICVNLNVS
ncbi:MAG TPA: flagellar biosynthesis protein FliA, partial [Ruminiclostridium sp.]|nr:flagellar biosynthesis protein FliA [Ruminiclostridium sp.]